MTTDLALDCVRMVDVQSLLRRKMPYSLSLDAVRYRIRINLFWSIFACLLEAIAVWAAVNTNNHVEVAVSWQIIAIGLGIIAFSEQFCYHILILASGPPPTASSRCRFDLLDAQRWYSNNELSYQRNMFLLSVTVLTVSFPLFINYVQTNDQLIFGTQLPILAWTGACSIIHGIEAYCNNRSASVAPT